jgi:periplasmic divalent cation tolerance protein
VTAIVTVYATFASDEEARRIGRQCVEERLAACVNVLGHVHSVYRWQGRVEEAGEVAALFKSTANGAAALIARIGDLHSYEVPAVVAWPIVDALEPYREWVESEMEARR